MKTTPEFETAALRLIATASDAYLRMTAPHTRPFLPFAPDPPAYRKEWNATAVELAAALEDFSAQVFGNNDEGGNVT